MILFDKFVYWIYRELMIGRRCNSAEQTDLEIVRLEGKSDPSFVPVIFNKFFIMHVQCMTIHLLIPSAAS